MGAPGLVIGLTGGIACGKSTVARQLAGAHHIDLDAIAREVVEPGSPGLAEVAAAFGPAVMADDGGLDRARLGALVFADPAERARLERILHPRMVAEVERRLDEWRRGGGAAVAVIDAAILFELGLDRLCAETVTVEAAVEQQVARLMASRGMQEGDARARIAVQAGGAARRARADRAIDNDGAPSELAQRVRAWWGDLIARHGVARSEDPT